MPLLSIIRLLLISIPLYVDKHTRKEYLFIRNWTEMMSIFAKQS